MRHIHKLVVVEHLVESERSEVLVKDMLSVWALLLMISVLLLETLKVLLMVGLGSLLPLEGSLPLLATMLEERRVWSKKVLHEVTMASEWVSWPSLLSPLILVIIICVWIV